MKVARRPGNPEVWVKKQLNDIPVIRLFFRIPFLSDFAVCRISVFPNLRFCEFPNFRFPKFLNFRIFWHPNPQIFPFVDFWTSYIPNVDHKNIKKIVWMSFKFFRFPNFSNFRISNFLNFGFPDLPIFRFPIFLLFQLANILIPNLLLILSIQSFHFPNHDVIEEIGENVFKFWSFASTSHHLCKKKVTLKRFGVNLTKSNFH